MVAPVEDDGSNPISNIIKLATTSRNASKGPALFVFKTFLVSSTSAIVFGLGAGIMAPPLLGPGFSCMVGMGVGFVGGLIQRWRSDLSHAINALDEYPELMRFHIKQVMMNVYRLHALDNMEIDKWRADLHTNVRKQSVAIAAVYSAADALDAIRKHQEEQIIEQYMARNSTNVTQQFTDDQAHEITGHRSQAHENSENTPRPSDSPVKTLRLRPLVAVIGDSDLDDGQMQPDGERKKQVAFELGRALVDAGCRVMTGGRTGVMEWAFRGAASSSQYHDGDTLAVLPSDDSGDANPYASIVLPTSQGHYRNGVVASADAVIAVGGGAGTLNEVTFAWIGRREPIIAMTGLTGITAKLAGVRLDERGAEEGRWPIMGASTAEEAVGLVMGRVGKGRAPGRR